MSNVIEVLEALSKLTNGELAVLSEIISNLQTQTTKAYNNSELAILWSKFSLKTQQSNPWLDGQLDPTTGLTIVEPGYERVINYPFYFTDNVPVTGTPQANRSVSYMFGSTTFLGYANNANGSPYMDANYGTTLQNLANYEVVNYGTLMNAISVALGSIINVPTTVGVANGATLKNVLGVPTWV